MDDSQLLEGWSEKFKKCLRFIDALVALTVPRCLKNVSIVQFFTLKAKGKSHSWSRIIFLFRAETA
jgi:hypothetical protein